jgi:hypothetical protein
MISAPRCFGFASTWPTGASRNSTGDCETIEVAIFNGGDARERAIRFADREYGVLTRSTPAISLAMRYPVPGKRHKERTTWQSALSPTPPPTGIQPPLHRTNLCRSNKITRMLTDERAEQGLRWRDRQLYILPAVPPDQACQGRNQLGPPPKEGDARYRLGRFFRRIAASDAPAIGGFGSGFAGGAASFGQCRFERLQSRRSRGSGQIEAILGSATALGLRTGDNPARWEKHLENFLPPVKAVKARLYAEATVSRVHLNLVASAHMRCMMIASLRATATIARRKPRRLATAMPRP